MFFQQLQIVGRILQVLMRCPPTGCQWLVPLGTGPSGLMDNPALHTRPTVMYSILIFKLSYAAQHNTEIYCRPSNILKSCGNNSSSSNLVESESST